MTGWDWAALVIPLSYGVIVTLRCRRNIARRPLTGVTQARDYYTEERWRP
jgi:hypothetical protein